MKYYPKLKKFKASNVVFIPETKIATSYDWWVFVKPIGNKLVFNDYPYSISTQKHQKKVRDLLDTLGIKIDLVIATSLSLNDDRALSAACGLIAIQIEELRTAIDKKGSRQSTNACRAERIEGLKKEDKIIRKLIDRIT